MFVALTWKHYDYRDAEPDFLTNQEIYSVQRHSYGWTLGVWSSVGLKRPSNNLGWLQYVSCLWGIVYIVPDNLALVFQAYHVLLDNKPVGDRNWFTLPLQGHSILPLLGIHNHVISQLLNGVLVARATERMAGGIVFSTPYVLLSISSQSAPPFIIMAENTEHYFV